MPKEMKFRKTNQMVIWYGSKKELQIKYKNLRRHGEKKILAHYRFY